MLTLALFLALLQSGAPEVPQPLRRAFPNFVTARSERADLSIDWNAHERWVRLAGYLAPPSEGFRFVDVQVSTAFEPTGAASLGTSTLAIAGREGPRVCVEIWTVVDTCVGAGPDMGAATVVLVDRARVWERVDGDTIALLAWNPIPPRHAVRSLRLQWNASHELGRLDVDGLGWSTYHAEATPNDPAPEGWVCIPELDTRLRAAFSAEVSGRGLVTILSRAWDDFSMCDGVAPDLPAIYIELVDGDMDGRLDAGRFLDHRGWDAESWGQRSDLLCVYW